MATPWGSSSVVPSSPPGIGAVGTNSLATERVSKSQITIRPPDVPAARSVPRRLNATHVAFPRWSDSSMTSRMDDDPSSSPDEVDSVGFRGGSRQSAGLRGCHINSL
jgi:hypothetical protein